MTSRRTEGQRRIGRANREMLKGAGESFERAAGNPDTVKALGAQPAPLTTGGYAKRRKRDDWNYGGQGY